MCQMCDEAKLYMAQLEAADRKVTEAQKEGRKDDSTAGKPGTAASASASGRK